MKPKNSQILDLDLIDLTIDSLSFNGGRGVGRFDGVVVFVPGTAPQEKVRVRVTIRKPRFWEAELVEILEPSPWRREPPCSVADRCGGCCWQHVTYAAQVEQKKKILSDSLRSLKKYGEWETLPFQAATQEFNYRNRIQLQIRQGKSGFFAKRTHDLVEIKNCHIAEPALNRELENLRLDPQTQRIELAVDEAGQVIQMAGSRDPEAALFSQVNRSQNEVLKARVLDLVKNEPQWIMDLYSGAGNLTFPLRDRHPRAKMLAVDLSEASITRGRAAAPEGSRIEWIAKDVGAALKKRPLSTGEGAVILDPPRTGCDSQVIAELKRHSPKQIVYVSCNPSTFARDAVRLVEEGHYKLDSVEGLDMFPQTEHVEVIARFSRVK